jgi:hypothetical protein
VLRRVAPFRAQQRGRWTVSTREQVGIFGLVEHFFPCLLKRPETPFHTTGFPVGAPHAFMDAKKKDVLHRLSLLYVFGLPSTCLAAGLEDSPLQLASFILGLCTVRLTGNGRQYDGQMTGTADLFPVRHVYSLDP